MSNSKGIPPIPSKKNNPLQGSPILKVVTLGLQASVTEGRDKNIGYNTLAKQLNATILADSDVKISGMAIKRWCDEYYVSDRRESTANAVNLYSHYISMLNQVSVQMEIQSLCIDELGKKSEESVDEIMFTSKSLNAAMLTYEKLSARKQVILGTIGEIQNKVYGYMAASEVVEITLNAVMDKDRKLYDEIMKKLRENSEYMELFKKIKPE